MHHLLDAAVILQYFITIERPWIDWLVGWFISEIRAQDVASVLEYYLETIMN